ncbi:polysaccharide deacetylase family protein [Marinobacter sp. R17]|uniref:polysaccharide deacetylase family protein n=1 Tax=Marinobacter sp. R17 TaxID=2484250 RepID=UPI000F4C4814|nr:polysaccharide deacetylase family protein [Marinobacter sp. R17]ROT98389.1 polysaccharide deacetylase family protein [Marinobacter sp. R17]
MTLNQFIYKATRPLGGLQLARMLARHHPRILMYHRLSATDEPGKIHVDQFRKQMRLIKRHFHPMNLTELLEAHEQGNVPNHAVVVTFDDGYADFAEYAFPIMQEEGIPSTLFITTGFVNGDLWLWPDQLHYVIDEASIGGEPVYIDGMDKYVELLSDRDRAWNTIADYCLKIQNEKKESLISNLYHRLNVVRPSQAPVQYCGLKWSQIRKMVKSGLDVGSHSYSHPILTQLQDNELDKELKLSKLLIQKELNIETPLFCYPNGTPDDFNEKIKESISKAGYRYAVNAYPSRLPLSDTLSINRYPAVENMMLFEKTVFGTGYLFR